MFTVAVFTTTKPWKQPKYPQIEEWVRKMWYRNTTEYYSAMKGNEIMSFAATWKDLEKYKYRTILLICGI